MSTRSHDYLLCLLVWLENKPPVKCDAGMHFFLCLQWITILVKIKKYELQPMPYLRSLECSVGKQDAGSNVHHRCVSFSQVDVGDVSAEVVFGQVHHRDVVPLQGVLNLQIILAALWPHHQQSCLSEKGNQRRNFKSPSINLANHTRAKGVMAKDHILGSSYDCPLVGCCVFIYLFIFLSKSCCTKQMNSWLSFSRLL